MESICIEMINHVLNTEVHNPPHITWLTKNNLLWGKGSHWADQDCPDYLQEGLLKHAGIRKPSQRDLNYQMKIFGYCMEWPEPRCWSLTNIMKSHFINSKSNYNQELKARMNKKWKINSDYLEFIYGRGYIDQKTLKLDPDYTYGIVGWFVLHTAPEYREEQINWIKKQKPYIAYQYARNCDTFSSVVRQQITSAQNKQAINTDLLEQHVYKELRQRLVDEKVLPAGKIDYEGLPAGTAPTVIKTTMKRTKALTA